MQFRGGMNELVRQAARMQRKIDDVKKGLKDHEVTATSAGDKISVVVTCEGRLRRVSIDPEFLASEGLEMALDAVVAATNSALEAADKKVEGEITKVTVVVTCEGRVRRITIDPEFLASEGTEMALDAVVAATNSALEAADKKVEGEITKVTGGMKIPGMHT